MTRRLDVEVRPGDLLALSNALEAVIGHDPTGNLLHMLSDQPTAKDLTEADERLLERLTEVIGKREAETLMMLLALRTWETPAPVPER